MAQKEYMMLALQGIEKEGPRYRASVSISARAYVVEAEPSAEAVTPFLLDVATMAFLTVDGYVNEVESIFPHVQSCQPVGWEQTAQRSISGVPRFTAVRAGSATGHVAVASHERGFTLWLPGMVAPDLAIYADGAIFLLSDRKLVAIRAEVAMVEPE